MQKLLWGWSSFHSLCKTALWEAFSICIPHAILKFHEKILQSRWVLGTTLLEFTQTGLFRPILHFFCPYSLSLLRCPHCPFLQCRLAISSNLTSQQKPALKLLTGELSILCSNKVPEVSRSTRSVNSKIFIPFLGQRPSQSMFSKMLLILVALLLLTWTLSTSFKLS